MRAIKVYCPPGAEPPLYAFIDALDGKLKAIPSLSLSYHGAAIERRIRL